MAILKRLLNLKEGDKLHAKSNAIVLNDTYKVKNHFGYKDHIIIDLIFEADKGTENEENYITISYMNGKYFVSDQTFFPVTEDYTSFKKLIEENPEVFNKYSEEGESCLYNPDNEDYTDLDFDLDFEELEV